MTPMLISGFLRVSSRAGRKAHRRRLIMLADGLAALVQTGH
jgi:hypothetical protein